MNRLVDVEIFASKRLKEENFKFTSAGFSANPVVGLPCLNCSRLVGQMNVNSCLNTLDADIL